MRAPQSVFSHTDLALLWRKTAPSFLNKKIHRYLKAGALFPLRKGIYAKAQTFDPFELATKIFTPSYVGFETVLIRAGVVFQFYRQLFCASYLTREIIIHNQAYTYKKIKDAILTNAAGIETTSLYAIASVERAFLDTLYLYQDYHFDNLKPLCWEKVFEILPLYHNKRLEKSVNRIHKDFLRENT